MAHITDPPSPFKPPLTPHGLPPAPGVPVVGTQTTQPIPVEIVPIDKMPLTVKELDAMGMQKVYSVPFPDSFDFQAMTVPQKLWMMKTGPCAKYSLPMIFCLLSKTQEINEIHNVHLEPGVDVYPTGEGRYGISNTAQIKIAQASGKLTSMEWEYSEDGDDDDVTCTVTLGVRGLNKPISLTQRLGDWRRKTGPWDQQPRHMLLVNTLGHACKFVSPIGSDHDTDITPTAPDAPALTTDDLTPILEKSISAVREGNALKEAPDATSV